jgi:YVTN family beta-propeller protein
VAVSADGERVYVANGDGTVAVIETATNAVVGVVTVGGSPFGLAMHPDGDRLYVTNELGNTVSVITTVHRTAPAP